MSRDELLSLAQDHLNKAESLLKTVNTGHYDNIQRDRFYSRIESFCRLANSYTLLAKEMREGEQVTVTGGPLFSDETAQTRITEALRRYEKEDTP